MRNVVKRSDAVDRPPPRQEAHKKMQGCAKGQGCSQGCSQGCAKGQGCRQGDGVHTPRGPDRRSYLVRRMRRVVKRCDAVERPPHRQEAQKKLQAFTSGRDHLSGKMHIKNLQYMVKSNVCPVVVLHPAVKGFPGTVNTFLVRSFHDVDSPALFLKHASFSTQLR